MNAKRIITLISALLLLNSHLWSEVMPGRWEKVDSLKPGTTIIIKLKGGDRMEWTWQGNRIVSAKWVEAMTRSYVPLGPSQGYGYLWWTREYPDGADSVDAVMADGWGGQRIMVFADLDLVMVFTGGNYTETHRLDEAVSKYILPSLDRAR